MSVGTKLLQAAAGNAGEAVYVDDVFSCFLYEGNATSRSIVNGIDLADKGGLVWTKNRDDTYDHNFVDSARGLTNSPYIRSNTNGSQGTDGNGITVFNNNGYTVGRSGSWNANGNSHVSWTFAKQEKFFDIVTYTGNGTAGRTLSHNLGSVPGMIMIKRTDSSADWIVWHRAIRSSNPQNFFLKLNSNTGEVFGSYFDGGSYSNVLPTSTEITLGDSSDVNGNSATYVAYLLAHNEQEFGENSDEAIIKCDGYTGNGSTTGPIINLGFEPQWVLIKRTSANGDWMLFDIMRGIPTGSNVAALFPNAADAETSTDTWLELNPTGFQIKHDHGRVNVNSATYVYMAIARSNKPASEFAATELYTAAYMTSGPPLWNSNFPVGSGWYKQRAGTGSSVYLFSRLTDGGYMQTHSTGAESSAGAGQFDFQDGWYNSDQSATTYISWMFRRARGFFDVVAYTGDGSSTSFSHNLGATPELKIIKIRSDAFGWLVGGSAVTGGTRDYQLYLDTNAAQANTNYWGAVDSASAFSVVASNFLSNANGQTYIAYLFATVAGISKVGSYTGTGSDLNVDCGFSAGARFVLIKRTDSTGDWYLFDSLRGIVAGNDEYALLNTAAADVTNTDYIDPLSSGFTVTSSAPAGLNASSGTYIFLAIA
tara:strand:- start:66 stop:2018 length:1953 start_codon:yes stop_codon:yes gene_type:complete